jgi:hypothetical protein
MRERDYHLIITNIKSRDVINYYNLTKHLFVQDKLEQPFIDVIRYGKLKSLKLYVPRPNLSLHQIVNNMMNMIIKTCDLIKIRYFFTLIHGTPLSKGWVMSGLYSPDIMSWLNPIDNLEILKLFINGISNEFTIGDLCDILNRACYKRSIKIIKFILYTLNTRTVITSSDQHQCYGCIMQALNTNNYCIVKMVLNALKDKIGKGLSSNSLVIYMKTFQVKSEIIKLFLDYGININENDGVLLRSYLSNVLNSVGLYTDEKQILQMFDFFIQNGASVDLEDTNISPSPLILAIMIGSSALVKKILDRGITYQKKENFNLARVITSIANMRVSKEKYKQRMNIIKLLLDYCANVIDDNFKALRYAKGNDEILQLLNVMSER